MSMVLRILVAVYGLRQCTIMPVSRRRTGVDGNLVICRGIPRSSNRRVSDDRSISLVVETSRYCIVPYLVTRNTLQMVLSEAV